MTAMTYQQSNNFIKNSPLLFLVVLLIILLSILSWYATSDGFLSMMNKNGIQDDLKNLAAYVLSAVIVLLELVSLAAYRKTKKKIYLLGFTIALMVSVVLGQAFYGRELGFTNELLTQQTDQLETEKKRELLLFLSSMEGLKKRLNELQKHSAKEASSEATSKRGGCHSRCRERQNDDSRLTKFNEVLGEQVKQLNTLADTVSNMKNIQSRQKALKDLTVYSAMYSSLEDNTELNNLNNFLKEGVIKYRRGSSAQASYLGKDARFVALGEDILQGINTIHPVSNELVLPYSGDNASLHRSTDVMVALLNGNFEVIAKTDWIALILALIIDLAILYLTNIYDVLSWVRNRAKAANRESDFNLNLFREVLDSTELSSGAALIDKLEKAIIKETDNNLKIDASKGACENLICSILEGMKVTTRLYQSAFITGLQEKINIKSANKIYLLPKMAFIELKKAAYQFDHEIRA